MIEAKPKREGLQPEDGEPADRSNVIELIATLKKSLASDAAKQPAKAAAPAAAQRQSAARAKPAAKKRVAVSAPKKAATRLGAPSPCQ